MGRRSKITTMARKRPRKAAPDFAPPPPPDAFTSTPASKTDAQAQTSGFSLHDLFAQQARTMLDRTDLDEEQKQSVLIAMSCPCCGAGGLSFTAKLKQRK
jgi:hypothetical protein